MKRISNAIKTVLWAVAESLYLTWLRFEERAGLILYAAHTGVESVTNATFAISATLPATYDAAGYGLTSIVYTLISEIESFSAYGSVRAITKFQPISGPVEKMKGPPDYGDIDISMADLPLDAGQVILKAAEASSSHYSLKVTYADGEIHYLDFVNFSWSLNVGKAGEALNRLAKLGVCKAPVIVPAP
jgi:hypothetical protein